MSDLPTPEGWNKRLFVFVVALVFAGGGGAYFAFKTVVEAEHTHWMAAVITTAAAVTLLIIAIGIALLLAGRVRLRASFDSTTGTTLRPAPVNRWLAVIAICMITGPSLYLIYGARVQDDLGTVTSRDRGRLPLLVIGGVVVLVLMIWNRRRGQPTLRISAGGVDYNDVSTRFAVSWDEVVDIVGFVPKRRNFRPVVFECKDGPPAVINNAAAYAPGGVALFWTIRHYWLNPQDRPELANGLAIERLTAERFIAQ